MSTNKKAQGNTGRGAAQNAKKGQTAEPQVQNTNENSTETEAETVAVNVIAKAEVEMPRNLRKNKTIMVKTEHGMVEVSLNLKETSGSGGQGRPVDPNSKRQQHLAEMAEKAEERGGELRQGRPVDPNSERQKRLAEMKEKGTTGKRGRPVDPESERQQRLKEQKERAEANGGVVKKGRPAETDTTPIVVQATVVNEQVEIPAELIEEATHQG